MVIAVVLVFSFFITSADSATFVLGMTTEDGCLEPHRRTKAVWGVLLSLIASALLVNGATRDEACALVARAHAELSLLHDERPTAQFEKPLVLDEILYEGGELPGNNLSAHKANGVEM